MTDPTRPRRPGAFARAWAESEAAPAPAPRTASRPAGERRPSVPGAARPTTSAPPVATPGAGRQMLTRLRSGATAAASSAAAGASTVRARAAASRATAKPAAASSSHTPRPRRRATPTTGGVRIPKGRAASRPGGPSARGRTAPQRNRIEPAKARGSWVSAMSWRLVVIVGVVVLAAAVVLPSLRAYFRQQEELASLRAEAVAAQESVDDLTAEVKRWDDPAFVVAQARERLAYVFPGETPYRVIDPETVEGAAEGSPAAEDPAEIDESGTWYTRLWDSVETAGEAKVGGGKAKAAASSTAAD
ncbi:septum formation initiator family protein [Demequina sp. SYSU T00192]|uniref:Septum formation initiator family protein n=1 Tax=Demequina litoralis TaxID=3051660 RepID=A0ABT8G9C5_9MICO|nr:septum formation initiator family protein [Demequina sp. SYSU T00192]MDN4475597.1 septum formation initiator family protein [Demequina sp. SYSU T00192]